MLCYTSKKAKFCEIDLVLCNYTVADSNTDDS